MTSADQDYRTYTASEISEHNPEMSFPAPPPPIDTAMLYSTQSYKPMPKSSMRSTKPFSVSNIGNTGTSRPANNKNEMSEVIAAVAKKGQAMSERNKLAYGTNEKTPAYNAPSVPDNGELRETVAPPGCRATAPQTTNFNSMINCTTPRGFKPATFNAQPVTNNSVYKPVKAYQPNKQLEHTAENQAYRSLQMTYDGASDGAPIRATIHAQTPLTKASVTVTPAANTSAPAAAAPKFLPNQPVPSPFKQLEQVSNISNITTTPYATPLSVTTTKPYVAPISATSRNHYETPITTTTAGHKSYQPASNNPTLSNNTAVKTHDTTRLEDKLKQLSAGGNMPDVVAGREQTAAFRAYTYRPNGKPFEATNNNNNNNDTRTDDNKFAAISIDIDTNTSSGTAERVVSAPTAPVTMAPVASNDLYSASGQGSTSNAPTNLSSNVYIPNVGANKSVTQNAQRNTNLFGASAAPITRAPATQGEIDLNDLTKALIQGMDTPKEANFAGVCHKCNKSIVGHNQCCTAMEKTYHVNCFTCFQCDGQLQGKSFFSLDSKPHCETCYIQTLEKCSSCHQPITDRILRATGNAYHPDCFVCTVCERSLDGIPFTVDNDSMIYCIDDFHAKFAPRCDVCQQCIKPETGSEETVRIVAMDRSFHVDCYRCEDCSVSLASDVPEGSGCYPLDDHILCKTCNGRRVQKLTTEL